MPELLPSPIMHVNAETGTETLHRTSLSSPPSWMTCPMDARLWALIKHCFLHSNSRSRSRHIFICSMLALWFSLTIFCCSRNFCSPHRIRQTGKGHYLNLTCMRPTSLCYEPFLGHIFSPCQVTLVLRCSSCKLPYKIRLNSNSKNHQTWCFSARAPTTNCLS